MLYSAIHLILTILEKGKATVISLYKFLLFTNFSKYNPASFGKDAELAAGLKRRVAASGKPSNQTVYRLSAIHKQAASRFAYGRCCPLCRE